MDITARQVRQQLLNSAPEIVDTYISLGLNGSSGFVGDSQALGALYKSVVPLVSLSDDVVKIALDDKEPVETQIISLLINGDISINDTREYLKSLQMAKDLTDLRELMEKVEALSNGEFDEPRGLTMDNLD